MLLDEISQNVGQYKEIKGKAIIDTWNIFVFHDSEQRLPWITGRTIAFKAPIFKMASKFTFEQQSNSNIELKKKGAVLVLFYFGVAIST